MSYIFFNIFYSSYLSLRTRDSTKCASKESLRASKAFQFNVSALNISPGCLNAVIFGG